MVYCAHHALHRSNLGSGNVRRFASSHRGEGGGLLSGVAGDCKIRFANHCKIQAFHNHLIQLWGEATLACSSCSAVVCNQEERVVSVATREG